MSSFVSSFFMDLLSLISAMKYFFWNIEVTGLFQGLKIYVSFDIILFKKYIISERPKADRSVEINMKNALLHLKFLLKYEKIIFTYAVISFLCWMTKNYIAGNEYEIWIAWRPSQRYPL